MSTPDEQLDAMLSKPDPYLEDGGFTQRVLAGLPPRRQASRARGKILLGSAAAAGLVLVLGPARVATADLLAQNFSWPAVASMALSLAVLAGTAISVALREAER